MKSKKFEPDWATHPGEHIAEYIESLKWSQADLSRATGIRPGRISEIISGKRGVTAQIAVSLQRAFGVSAEIWLNLQTNYDLFLARRKRDSQK